MCMQAALHPTPAVCGRPRADAKALLADREPFDRGYYAGPFGWISGCAAEFVVAIRSALLQAPPHQHSKVAEATGSPDTQAVQKGPLPMAPTSKKIAVLDASGSGVDATLSSSPQARQSSIEAPVSSNGSGRAASPIELNSDVSAWQHSRAEREVASRDGQRIISLFAGVGIVRGSTASSEWQVSVCQD